MSPHCHRADPPSRLTFTYLNGETVTQLPAFYFTPALVLAGAIVLGLAGGFAFERIRRLILPSSSSHALLGRLPGEIRGMLTADVPSEMLKHYKAVLVGMLRWSARSVAALAIGLAPVALAFMLVAAWDPSARTGDKDAFCTSAFDCALFEMMLFDTHRSPELERSIVVRTAAFDRNPVWPYVNDLELAFFTAVVLGGAGAAWLERKRRTVRR